jgi:hypothetical protein
MGLLVSVALLTFGTATFTFTMEALAARHPAWEMPTSFLHFLGAASFGLFLYLFSGRVVRAQLGALGGAGVDRLAGAQVLLP